MSEKESEEQEEDLFNECYDLSDYEDSEERKSKKIAFSTKDKKGVKHLWTKLDSESSNSKTKKNLNIVKKSESKPKKDTKKWVPPSRKISQSQTIINKISITNQVQNNNKTVIFRNGSTNHRNPTPPIFNNGFTTQPMPLMFSQPSIWYPPMPQPNWQMAPIRPTNQMKRREAVIAPIENTKSKKKVVADWDPQRKFHKDWQSLVSYCQKQKFDLPKKSYSPATRVCRVVVRVGEKIFNKGSIILNQDPNKCYTSTQLQQITFNSLAKDILLESSEFREHTRLNHPVIKETVQPYNKKITEQPSTSERGKTCGLLPTPKNLPPMFLPNQNRDIMTDDASFDRPGSTSPIDQTELNTRLQDINNFQTKFTSHHESVDEPWKKIEKTSIDGEILYEHIKTKQVTKANPDLLKNRENFYIFVDTNIFISKKDELIRLIQDPINKNVRFYFPFAVLQELDATIHEAGNNRNLRTKVQGSNQSVIDDLRTQSNVHVQSFQEWFDKQPDNVTQKLENDNKILKYVIDFQKKCRGDFNLEFTKICFLLTNDKNLRAKGSTDENEMILTGNLTELKMYLSGKIIPDSFSTKALQDEIEYNCDRVINTEMEYEEEALWIQLIEIMNIDFCSLDNFFYQLVHLWFERFFIEQWVMHQIPGGCLKFTPHRGTWFGENNGTNCIEITENDIDWINNKIPKLNFLNLIELIKKSWHQLIGKLLPKDHHHYDNYKKNGNSFKDAQVLFRHFFIDQIIYPPKVNVNSNPLDSNQNSSIVSNPKIRNFRNCVAEWLEKITRKNEDSPYDKKLEMLKLELELPWLDFYEPFMRLITNVILEGDPASRKCGHKLLNFIQRIDENIPYFSSNLFDTQYEFSIDYFMTILVMKLESVLFPKLEDKMRRFLEAVTKYFTDLDNLKMIDYEDYIQDVFHQKDKQEGIVIDYQNLVWVVDQFSVALEELITAGKQKKLYRDTLNNLIFSEHSVLQNVENLSFIDNYEYCNLHQIGPNSYLKIPDSGFQFIPAFRAQEGQQNVIPSLFETVTRTQSQIFVGRLAFCHKILDPSFVGNLKEAFDKIKQLLNTLDEMREVFNSTQLQNNIFSENRTSTGFDKPKYELPKYDRTIKKFIF